MIREQIVMQASEAYIVGIVPQPMPFNTLSRQARRPESPEASGVVSGKNKMRKMSFSRNLIRYWR